MIQALPQLQDVANELRSPQHLMITSIRRSFYAHDRSMKRRELSNGMASL